MKHHKTLPALASLSLLLTVGAWAQSTTETYDANGNTLTTGGKSFSYDSENHLIGMNGSAVTLQYDGDGNLISKTVGGVTANFLVDDHNPTGLPQVMEETSQGAVQRRYGFGQQRVSLTQSINGTITTSFYGYDGQGNVRQLTNTAGAVTDTYDYDAFGNLLHHTGTTPNNYLYRGELYDPDLGLYYLRARWYNPVTGRFMSRDPKDGDTSDPASLHKYNYAAADPVNKMDPTGREAVAEYPGLIALGTAATLGVTAATLAAHNNASGVQTLASDIVCSYSADASAIKQVAASLGTPLSVTLDYSDCSAKVKCEKECNPRAGTMCFDKQSGHSHGGFDPHFHIYTMNQNPQTCECFWNKKRLNDGAVGVRPEDMNPCQDYLSSPDPWVPQL